LYFINFWY